MIDFLCTTNKDEDMVVRTDPLEGSKRRCLSSSTHFVMAITFLLGHLHSRSHSCNDSRFRTTALVPFPRSFAPTSFSPALQDVRV